MLQYFCGFGSSQVCYPGVQIFKGMFQFMTSSQIMTKHFCFYMSVSLVVSTAGVRVWSVDRYDNEYGYSTRVCDLVKFVNSRDHP